VSACKPKPVNMHPVRVSREVLCHDVGEHVGSREVRGFDGVPCPGITEEVEVDAGVITRGTEDIDMQGREKRIDGTLKKSVLTNVRTHTHTSIRTTQIHTHTHTRTTIRTHLPDAIEHDDLSQ